jgi:hypothetical protein
LGQQLFGGAQGVPRPAVLLRGHAALRIEAARWPWPRTNPIGRCESGKQAPNDQQQKNKFHKFNF